MNTETAIKLFYETHDTGKSYRQSPHIGIQYRSGIFYGNTVILYQ